MRTHIASLFCTLLVLDASAQITLIGTLPSSNSWPTRVVRSLTSGGAKLLEIDATGFNLYNLDLTLYQAITFPAPPAGYAWHWEYPTYPTEDVFDSDPSTIEFMLMAAQPGINYTLSTAILRQDGTLVFWAPALFPTGPSGMDDFTAGPSVFNTPSGAVMGLLDTLNVHHYYQLPGMLPCIECDGTLSSSMAVGGSDLSEPATDGMALYPNPAGQGTEVIFDLPKGINAKALVLVDMAGQSVKRLAVPAGVERMTITTADVSSGTYSFHLETERGIVPGKRLIIVK